MRTAFAYGALLGLSLFVCLLGLHVAGFTTDTAKVDLVRTIESLLGYVFLMACLLACLRQRQRATPNVPLGFGRALATGAVLALTGGLVLGVGHWVYGTLINPGHQETLREALLIGHELTPEQLAELEPRLRFITSPLGIAIGQGVPLVAFGVLMSLVVAVFFRRSGLAAVPPPAA